MKVKEILSFLKKTDGISREQKEAMTTQAPQ
jgi:hypothetical protein